MPIETESVHQDYTTLSVTELNRQVRLLLENKVGAVFVLGELSNFTKASSGHLYFTLKDEKAQIRCAFFRNAHGIKELNVQDGQQVIAKGRLSLYEPRGEYQLIVQELFQTGIGALYQQFENLKKKLMHLGLFDVARKKSIPKFPQTIGIISSLKGAALQDILAALKRRYPLAHLYLYPSEVQGKNAANLLIQAIQKADYQQKAEVLILARGGGSIEDLWPFNDEQLAYAISECRIPIISGVGHETDFTISDFVADKRAATPTAAAEAATPNQADILVLLESIIIRLHQLMLSQLRQCQSTLAYYQTKLISPKQVLFAQAQTVDYLEKQALHALRQRFYKWDQTLKQANAALQAINPLFIVRQYQEALMNRQLKLRYAMQNIKNNREQRYVQNATLLAALNPLSTLERGFAVVTYQGKILFDSHMVQPADLLHLKLAKGGLTCKVIKHDPEGIDANG